MMAMIRWFNAAFVAVAVGTFVTLLVVLTMLWFKGALADERVYGMLAALQGVKAAKPAEKAIDPNSEQPSFNQILEARTVASLDLDLRETAIDKSLGELRTLESQLRTESRRLDDWKTSFDKRLTDLQTAATEASLLELQRTLEAIAPKQAKEQLLKMLEEPKTGSDDPMEDIVRILKAMPLEKRKKILAEFKTPEDVEKLHEILKVVRLGGSDTQLLQETRGQIQQGGM